MLAREHESRAAVLDAHRAGGGVHWTYAELAAKVAAFAGGLRGLGVTRGDRVALYAESSAHWLASSQGVLAAGGVAVLRGVGAAVEELAFVFEDSGSSGLVVENAAVLRRLVDGGFDAFAARFIVILFGGASGCGGVCNGEVLTFEDVVSRGQDRTVADGAEIDESSGDMSNGIAVLLYTFGESANRPRGVPLSHGNLLSQVDRVSLGRSSPRRGDVFLSMLTCWHALELTAQLWALSRGMLVVFSNKRRFREDLRRHRPHLLVVVPRLLEYLQENFTANLLKTGSRMRKVLTFLVAASVLFIRIRRIACGLSLRVSQKSNTILRRLAVATLLVSLAPLHAVAQLFVWRRLRATTGGRVRAIACSASAISEEVDDFFEAGGLPVYAGYGMTEASPCLSSRVFGHNVRWSAGLPLPGTDITIVDLETDLPLVQPNGTGEIRAAGPQIFRGYHNDAATTAAAFDAAGRFRTGDVGHLSHTGDLMITDRLTHHITLSNGETTFASALELAITASSPLIDDVLLVGHNARRLCALVVPHLPALAAAGYLSYQTQTRFAVAENAGPLRDAALRGLGADMSVGVPGAEIRAAVRAVAPRVSRVRLVLEAWTWERGFTGDDGNVRRDIVERVYEREIGEMCGSYKVMFYKGGSSSRGSAVAATSRSRRWPINWR